MDGLQGKEKMTMEELKEKLKEVCQTNKWYGSASLLETWFTDRDKKTRYYVVYGFIQGMSCAGIITDEECELFINTLLENDF